MRERPFRGRYFSSKRARARQIGMAGRSSDRSAAHARIAFASYNDGRSPELATIRSFGYANNSRDEFTPPVFHIYLRRLRDRSLFS